MVVTIEREGLRYTGTSFVSPDTDDQATTKSTIDNQEG